MKKKIFNNIKSLLVLTLALLLGAGVVVSCDDDNEGSGKVILSSFGPSGVKHGDMIKFIGQNLDKVSSIVLPGIEIPKGQFASVSPRLIELTVPVEAQAGKVILRTPDGDIESKTVLNFEVPVVITSITAEAKPGTNITIAGSLVNWIEEVTFNDGVVTTEFVSKSPAEVVLKVPMEAQTGFLIFSTGGTEPLTFASESELTVTLPTVTGINPEAIRHADNLAITGTDLDLVTAVVFAGDLTVSTFVSQSETEIVVSVPSGALKGTLTLKQASPIDVVSADELSVILPVGTNIAPKPAVPGVDNVTITGTDLDLVAELTLPGSGAIQSSAFVSHTPTQIVLAVPVGAKSGGILYTTIHGYSNNLGATLVVPGAGPSPLAISLYDETLAPGGGDWSWNTVVSDRVNTEQFYSGDVSWKFETDNGGGLSAGGISPIDASTMGFFSFSLFGGPGTDGAQVACILNDKWDSYNAVTLVEGQWTQYQIPLTSYPTVDLAAIVRFAFKVETTSSVIYADRVGFEPAGPPPLAITMYDETLAAGGGDWSWNIVVSDRENTEQARVGDVSWKFETGNGGGLSAGGLTPIDASGVTYFSFSLYGGPGTDGAQVACILNDKWDSYNAVTLVEGEWTEYQIPLTNYATVDLSAIVRFAFKVESTSSVIFADRVGFE